MFLRAPNPAPVLMLTRPYATPRHFRDWVGQWIPLNPSWNWARQFENIVFGRRKVVNLSTEIFSLKAATNADETNLTLGQPDFANATGLRLWFLKQSKLKLIRDSFRRTSGIETINHPRISTAEGCACTLFSGESILVNGMTNQVGIGVSYLAEDYQGLTELYASLELTEAITNQADARGEGRFDVSVQTNLDVAVRLRLPIGTGVFLLNRDSTILRGSPIGVIIDPP